MKWIEVSIKTTSEAVEAVANILYDGGVAGVSIEDENDFSLLEQSNEAWDYVDEALLDRELEGALVKGYLPEAADLAYKLELIRQSVALLPKYGLNIGLGEVTTLEVNEEDWSHSWKKYYKPTHIGKNIVVKPTWEEYERKEGEMIIEMDPGMAFGTGTHETTMMCAQELEKIVGAKYTVFDIGCGSGILSIVAAKLGAEKVIAVDLDGTAIRVTQENVDANDVSDIVEVRHGNLMDVVTSRADVIVANIIADIIILLSKDVKNFLKKEGIFIASGIILDKVEVVKAQLIANNLEIVKVETMGEWAVIISKLKGGVDE
ncbi:ribosomal protein L11 methyltransferase [Alkaliphilus metalliredigens QYMF]|uniref:Ribosomal protein L11 methyltransferase n=1 Tax=Alkaliphilus metalliredigens (strain QYMF) TaxID=293826 RepID=PRMA_ALKMQ|nr:50S ribosomal protein L11 methyltransferase [Alkaliphilus metalliredigens]A6TSL8.1 RecName: Full=Ribosomal protein L11 methyltransferase; Short=L11 Mtase [Alkaliphilus metalliredigens QYMF]ABR49186.1 ribosomal protein L11 methyltransferase [Alkaliphilus metalliredigens QYMF]